MAKKYDLYAHFVKYDDVPDGKYRPVLVLEENKVVPLSAPITSNLRRANYSGNVIIADWKEAGLHKPSVVRLEKTTNMELKSGDKYIGHLTEKDIINIEKHLSGKFNLEEDIIPYYYKSDGTLVAGYDPKTGATLIPKDLYDEWD